MIPRFLFLTLATTLLLPGKLSAGSLDPTNAPGSTMHSLDEIYQELMWLHSRVNSSTVTVTVTTMSTLVGTLAKSGQTNSYFTGDDGSYQMGAELPHPRFTIGSGASSNCVWDHLTGLVWLRNPDVTPKNWTNAINFCEALDGIDGRGDFSDWRLPNYRELLSLIDANYVNPALPNTTGEKQCSSDDPFSGIQSDAYWTGTTFAGNTNNARVVNIGSGLMNDDYKTTARYVWPVRGEPIIYQSATLTNISTGYFNPPLEEVNPSFSGNTISFTTKFTPIRPGSVTVAFADGAKGSATDNGSGTLSGSYLNVIPGEHPASGTIVYVNGQVSLFFPDVLGLQSSRVTIRYAVSTSN
jgi:hypothetical protein